jgi:hypothetical protein
MGYHGGPHPDLADLVPPPSGTGVWRPPPATCGRCSLFKTAGCPFSDVHPFALQGDCSALAQYVPSAAVLMAKPRHAVDAMPPRIVPTHMPTGGTPVSK